MSSFYCGKCPPASLREIGRFANCHLKAEHGDQCNFTAPCDGRGFTSCDTTPEGNTLYRECPGCHACRPAPEAETPLA